MMLFTREPGILALVQDAYRKAAIPGGGATLWVRNTRVQLLAEGEVVCLDGSTAIYLDKVLQDLRIYTGRTPCPRDHTPVVFTQPGRGGRPSCRRRRLAVSP